MTNLCIDNRGYFQFFFLIKKARVTTQNKIKKKLQVLHEVCTTLDREGVD